MLQSLLSIVEILENWTLSRKFRIYAYLGKERDSCKKKRWGENFFQKALFLFHPSIYFWHRRKKKILVYITYVLKEIDQ